MNRRMQSSNYLFVLKSQSRYSCPEASPTCKACLGLEEFVPGPSGVNEQSLQLLSLCDNQVVACEIENHERSLRWEECC